MYSCGVGWPARTYLQQLCANTGCSLEDLPGAMDDRDGWWERVREICVSSETSWWYIYIIYTRVSQKFRNSWLTYLLYSSSYNKISQTFKVEAIMLHHVKTSFSQFFYPMLLILVFQAKELPLWYYHLLFVEASQMQEVSHWSEQIII